MCNVWHYTFWHQWQRDSTAFWFILLGSTPYPPYPVVCFTQLLDLMSLRQVAYWAPTTGSLKKQESSRKTSISALLTMPKSLTVWITINWKILKEMGIPDHLNNLLRNLYAGQEATVRTGHGTTDWFQIGKGVHQGYVLSLCLFNLYAEYIMRNARLEEAQAGI